MMIIHYGYSSLFIQVFGHCINGCSLNLMDVCMLAKMLRASTFNIKSKGQL